MTREQAIDKMIKKAIAITGKNTRNYTYGKEREIWDIAEKNEIFMCVMGKDDDHPYGGFYIEDDMFVYNEEV